MELSLFIDSLKLTLYEKEATLYLSTVEDADAKTIYKNAKIPQGRIYSVLQELMQKGFVDVIPTKPKRYCIKDIRKSFKEYLDKKQTELKEKYLQVDKLSLMPKNTLAQEKTPSVHFYTGRDEHLAANVAMRNNANKEMFQLAPSFKGNFASRLSVQKALARGVAIKIITVKITKENTASIQNCIKYGGEVRVLDTTDIIPLSIRDSQEMILGIQNADNSEQRMMMSTTSKSLIRLFQEYFNRLWRQAKPVRK